MAASLLGAGCLLAGGAAGAQELPKLAPSPYSSWRPLTPPPTQTPATLTAPQTGTRGATQPAAKPILSTDTQADAPAPTFSYSKPAHAPVSAAPAPEPTFTYRKPAYASVPSVEPVAYQPPVGGPEVRTGYQIQVDPPGPEQLFGRLESEASMQERWRQLARQTTPPERLVFPEEPVVSKMAYAGRQWPPLREVVEPAYVCYSRLYFEEKNSERYGWEIGFLQPFLSTGAFYADLIKLPYDWAKDPFRCYECSAGYCLPGSPVPYMLYPPGCSATGLLGEAGAVVALFFIFP